MFNRSLYPAMDTLADTAVLTAQAVGGDKEAFAKAAWSLLETTAYAKGLPANQMRKLKKAIEKQDISIFLK
jgi:hypothetical protein